MNSVLQQTARMRGSSAPSIHGPAAAFPARHSTIRCVDTSTLATCRVMRQAVTLPSPFTKRHVSVPRTVFAAATVPRGSGSAAASYGRADEGEILGIPQSLNDVDNGKILGFGAELAEGHPGWGDEAYMARRMDIVGLARAHVPGSPIPRVSYTPAEVATWSTALRRLTPLHDQHACKEWLRNAPLFGFREGDVPQLEDVSAVLKAATGFQIRPVAGLLHPRDFLAGLAFKTFHSTQYMRHHSNPMYTPEPDVIHELLGHVPMLADRDFAAMAHAIGVASLGATEKAIWHLTKVYWHTVEFGVVREGRQAKAFGAGILSSYGEMEHMAHGGAVLKAFDPRAPQPKMSYKDGFQQHYFVLESFEEGARQLREFSEEVRRPPGELGHVLN